MGLVPARVCAAAHSLQSFGCGGRQIGVAVFQLLGRDQHLRLEVIGFQHLSQFFDKFGAANSFFT